MAVLRTVDKQGNVVDENGNIIATAETSVSTKDSESVEGQLGFDLDGTVIVPNVEMDKPEIIEQDGTPAVVETEIVDKKKVNINQLMIENPEQALQYLMLDQSNDKPAKKGGPSIAFRCDALILACRANMNAHENLMADIIMANVSSFPANKIYRVYASDVAEHLPYKDKNYINKIMKKNFRAIHKKSIEITLNYNGVSRTRDIHLVSVIDYLDSDDLDIDDKSNYIEFTVEPFTKALYIASGRLHGAYYRIDVSAKLVGKAKLLFYYCQSLKTYKSYQGAKLGRKYLTVQEMCILLNIKSTYKVGDIKSKILDPAAKKINEIPDVDIHVTVTSKFDSKKNTIGYYLDVEEVLQNVKIEDKKTTPPLLDDHIAEKSLLQALSLKEDEITKILEKYVEYERDIMFLMDALTIVRKKEDLKNPASYLTTLMEKGLIKEPEKKKEVKKNSFNNFNQRDYDYDDLEKMLLGSSIDNQD